MTELDLGDDPDGDLDGYDGPVGCVCGPWARGGRRIDCPVHWDANLAVLATNDSVMRAVRTLTKHGIDGAAYAKLISRGGAQ